jgi:glycosyltransferase involved in cell wall biosynthesis
LVKAFALIPSSQRIPLIIVGRRTKYFKKVNAYIQSSGLANEVIFIDNIEFSELPAFYQMASAFIYPSLFEGFGIPLLEAAESGTPIITSTGSCFKEAAGKDAVFVDPLNTDDLVSAMIDVLNSDQSERIIKQKEHARNFWPEHSAKDITAFYQS